MLRSGLSLASETLSKLKALAKLHHGGDVSALLAELVEREEKRRAIASLAEELGIPPLARERAAEIDAEWTCERRSSAGASSS
ncbi:MAG: hypothetical protein KIT84_37435 [Labilithrix sp.]|nr:hypothetical protein [Labilithrix sp.]